MIVITKEQIIKLHEQLIWETGGSQGLRDDSLLDAAIHAPFQSYDGIDMFPSIQQKAARLGFGLVKNHAFIDGNKRIGAHVMLVFLALNKIELVYEQSELSDVILKIASDEYGFPELLQWILNHQQ